MEINLIDLTPDNWREVNSLKVKPEQQKYVAENVGILARAFAYRLDNSKVHVVSTEYIPIGLIMQRDILLENKLKGGRDTEKDLFGHAGGYITKLSKNTVKESCRICGKDIIKESYMGGSIYYCE